MQSPATEGVYLRPGVKIEPLVCGWPAWGHLLSPLTYALNLVNRHIPLLESFIANPAVHQSACLDPSMYGGFFVELSASDAPLVRERLSYLRAQSEAIGLAADWLQLERAIRETASGASLEPRYSSVPDRLRGVIELVYDLASRPEIRIITEHAQDLLPSSPANEAVRLWEGRDDARPFFLNTPRLDNDGEVHIKVPLSDRRLQVLFRSRLEPTSVSSLRTLLSIPDSQGDAFERMFTTEKPTRASPELRKSGIRVRYFGHACVLVESEGASFLIDPLLPTCAEFPEAAFSMRDLPDRIDVVAITHNHQDHLAAETLLQIRDRVGEVLVPASNRGCVADPPMRSILNRLGFTDVRVMQPFDHVDCGGFRVESIPFLGEHADLAVDGKHGIILRMGGEVIGFLADSNCLDRDVYRLIARRLGKVDRLFIGMECEGGPLSWLYSPYLAVPVRRRDDESRRLSGSDAERALCVVEELAPKIAYVYAMGQEPWLKYLCGLRYEESSPQLKEARKFVELCTSRDVPCSVLYGGRDL